MVSSYLDKMDVDGRDAYLEDKRREKTLCGCIKALEQSLQATNRGKSSCVLNLNNLNLTCIADILPQTISALQSISKTLPVRLRAVEAFIFTSIADIAAKLKTSVLTDSQASQCTDVQEGMKKILFAHDPQTFVESVRTKRTDAVLKISEVPGLGKRVLESAVLEAEIQKEPVKSLQEILRIARKNL
jgi:hypothetical protein